MKLSIEIVISLIILIILGVFLNPTHLLMPDSVSMLLIMALIVGFLSFVGLIWREQPKDERDLAHIQKSGRVSFLMGATILVVGIVLQAVRHDVDPWLIYALSAMVLTKLLTRMFHHFTN